ncbi:hypothetical protein [Crocosphaera chwakensis]|uniref:Uncharacterized protein n=1 Tax=Crocosphaera chwakensis CCY0110 TaxID=391612 RepID=A3IQR4_9CHRO|nr:hypothetical protein [Crocosphaera chwakensis]EAZ91119.1 hypothetical protein CY0110_12667 [Crocosphaera chwakensis CCY0110]
MITLNLDPELENKIQQETKLNGLSVEKYISLLIQESLENKYIQQSETLEYKAGEEKLNQFINRSVDVSIQPLSDEAISRENIYTREDKML